MNWRLHEAKQRFSEVIRRAVAEGPQVVTRHGEEIIVVVSVDDFRHMSGDRQNLKEFLLSGPDLSRLDLERLQEPTRESAL